MKVIIFILLFAFTVLPQEVLSREVCAVKHNNTLMEGMEFQGKLVQLLVMTKDKKNLKKFLPLYNQSRKDLGLPKVKASDLDDSQCFDGNR
jgi:hypothetical protein